MSKIVITQKDGIVSYGLFGENGPLELYVAAKEEQAQIGNVYAARVENQAAGIHGAFVKVSDTEKCFYPYGKTASPIKMTPGHEDKLCGGDIILVQLIKESAGNKLPVVSDNISINGAYFVLSTGDHRISVSKKITEKQEKERLHSIMSDVIHEKFPELQDSFGFVARTNAGNIDASLLEKDLEYLIHTYEELMRKAQISPGAQLLYQEPAHFITLAKELPVDTLEEIIVDDRDIYEQLRQYYSDLKQDDIVSRLRFYQDDYSLYALYRLEHYYEEALGRKVYLKSGGTLVIDRTEAMTVIDVNSGAVIKGKRKEDIYYKTNKEAADEILRQCRLRNLSGIILVDFINMKKKESEEKLLSYLKEQSVFDRNPVNVVEMTKLGLVEMTRTRKLLPLAGQWQVVKNMLTK